MQTQENNPVEKALNTIYQDPCSVGTKLYFLNQLNDSKGLLFTKDQINEPVSDDFLNAFKEISRLNNINKNALTDRLNTFTHKIWLEALKKGKFNREKFPEKLFQLKLDSPQSIDELSLAAADVYESLLNIGFTLGQLSEIKIYDYIKFNQINLQRLERLIKAGVTPTEFLTFSQEDRIYLARNVENVLNFLQIKGFSLKKIMEINEALREKLFKESESVVQLFGSGKVTIHSTSGNLYGNRNAADVEWKKFEALMESANDDQQAKIMSYLGSVAELIVLEKITWEQIVNQEEELRDEIFQNAYGISKLVLEAEVIWDELINITPNNRSIIFKNARVAADLIKEKKTTLNQLRNLPPELLKKILYSQNNIIKLLDKTITLDSIVSLKSPLKEIIIRNAKGVREYLNDGWGWSKFTQMLTKFDTNSLEKILPNIGYIKRLNKKGIGLYHLTTAEIKSNQFLLIISHNLSGASSLAQQLTEEEWKDLESSKPELLKTIMKYGHGAVKLLESEVITLKQLRVTKPDRLEILLNKENRRSLSYIINDLGIEYDEIQKLNDAQLALIFKKSQAVRTLLEKDNTLWNKLVDLQVTEAEVILENLKILVELYPTNLKSFFQLKDKDHQTYLCYLVAISVANNAAEVNLLMTAISKKNEEFQISDDCQNQNAEKKASNTNNNTLFSTSKTTGTNLTNGTNGTNGTKRKNKKDSQKQNPNVRQKTGEPSCVIS